MHTLRTRLILSHLLPLLVVIPLIAVTLVYVLETQVLLTNLSSELTAQAVLLGQLAMDQPRMWSEPEQAQLFIDRVSPLLAAHLMVLDPHGKLLAGSQPSDEKRKGKVIEVFNAQALQKGEITVRTTYSQLKRTEIADAFVPVLTSDQQVVGIVRLTYDLSGVYKRFLRMRMLILSILGAGMVVGVVVGWALALNLQRPIQQVTQGVSRISRGEQLESLSLEGPDEIQLLAKAVNNLGERLQSLERSRKQLLANLVHELGRPLGALRSAIQALQRGADQDQDLRQELLAGMDEEAHRLQHLLDDLAHLHEQVLGTLELDRRPVPLNEWLPHLLASWREAAQEKRLHWESSIPDGLPVVEVDSDRLGQAVGNLLSNAVKYTPPGGSVGVTAGCDDQAVWIRVQDSGPGIPPEEQDQIFKPFYRGRTGRRFPQGMGLGLSIACDLVEAHGGRLELESAPGLGSQFTIHLPLV